MNNNQKLQTPKSNQEQDGAILNIRRFKSSQTPPQKLQEITKPTLKFQLLESVQRQVSQDMRDVNQMPGQINNSNQKSEYSQGALSQHIRDHRRKTLNLNIKEMNQNSDAKSQNNATQFVERIKFLQNTKDNHSNYNGKEQDTGYFNGVKSQKSQNKTSFSFNNQMSLDKKQNSNISSTQNIKSSVAMPEMSVNNSGQFGMHKSPQSEIMSAVMIAQNPNHAQLGVNQQGHVSFKKIEHNFIGGHISFGQNILNQNILKNIQNHIKQSKQQQQQEQLQQDAQQMNTLGLDQQNSILLMKKDVSVLSNNDRSQKSFQKCLNIAGQVSNTFSSGGERQTPYLNNQKSELSHMRRINPFGNYEDSSLTHSENQQKMMKMDSVAMFKQEEQLERIKYAYQVNKRGQRDMYDRDSLSGYNPVKLEKEAIPSDASNPSQQMKMNFEQMKNLQGMQMNKQQSFGANNNMIQREPQQKDLSESAFQQFVPINLTININNFGNNRGAQNNNHGVSDNSSSTILAGRYNKEVDGKATPESNRIDIKAINKEITLNEKQQITESNIGKQVSSCSAHPTQTVREAEPTGIEFMNKREEKMQEKDQNSQNDHIGDKTRQTRGKGKKTLQKYQQLQQEMQLIELRKKGPDDNIICKCSKSKCLKMYCECFTQGFFCDERCTCCTCHNAEANQHEIRTSRAQIKSRNKIAFNSKRQKLEEVVQNQEEELQITQQQPYAHQTGCKCKKSNCQKKYCECFQMGMICIPGVCQCCDCKNNIQK